MQQPGWIELRAQGKMFGRLSSDGRLLEVKERGLLLVFDLASTLAARRAISCDLTRLLVDENERCAQEGA